MIDIKIGNAYELIKTIPDKSVNCICTSSPYYALRDYKTEPIIFDGNPNCEHEWGSIIPYAKKDERTAEEKILSGVTVGNTINYQFTGNSGSFCSKCGAWKGQLGMEPSPEDFIRHLVHFFDLARPKLTDDGNIYANLADSYWGSGHDSGKSNLQSSQTICPSRKVGEASPIDAPTKYKHSILKPKSLCLVPSRFAWSMVEHGWILRTEICWFKLNSMPESVQDRWKKSHEMIYHFTKQGKYYFDLDAIRKPLSTSSIKRIVQPNVMNQTGGIKQDELRGNPESGNASRCNKMVQALAQKYCKPGANTGENNKEPYKINNPHLMRLKGTEYDGKWKENSEYMNNMQQRINDIRESGVPHDQALSNPLGKNPGDVYEANIEYSIEDIINTWKEMHPEDWTVPGDVFKINTRGYSGSHFAVYNLELIKDLILAGCPEGGTVLDPFLGSGTTLEFCKNNNRNGIGFELNPNYKALIDVRTKIEPKTKSLFDF